jgi:hypothetical protein
MLFAYYGLTKVLHRLLSLPVAWLATQLKEMAGAFDKQVEARLQPRCNWVVQTAATATQQRQLA